MSKAITFQDFVGMLDKIVQKIHAIGKVPFPKADQIGRLSGLESVPVLANEFPSQTSMFADYAIGLPTLGMVTEIEPISPLAQEFPADMESFMPLELPVQSPKERATKKPAAALHYNKVRELPLLNQVPAQREPINKSLGTNDLKNLLAALEETGMKVKEVKSLPSGATRITFDEFMASRKIRQSEFVRVGVQ